MSKGVLSCLIMSLMILSISCSQNTDSSVSSKMVCDTGGSSDVGVFGGKILSPESLIGRGMVVIKNGKYMCSGSLIDRNIVLTAAHCVPDDESTAPVEIIFSGDPICQLANEGRSVFKPVDRIIRHQLFREANHDSQYDLALIRLSNPAPEKYQPLKLVDHSVTFDSSTRVYVSGFGKSSADYNVEDSENPRLKSASVQLLQTSDDPEKVVGSNDSKVLYLDQRNGQGGCSGDSGGATFLKEAGQLSILGVNSAVDSLQKQDFRTQDEVTCRQGLRIVSVFAQRDWISTSYQQLLNSDSLGNQFSE